MISPTRLEVHQEVHLHSFSSKAPPLLLTLDEVAPPDLEHEVVPLGPPAQMHLTFRVGAQRQEPLEVH